MNRSSKNRIRVLAVDHTVVRQGLQSLFGEEGVEVIGFVGNVASAKSAGSSLRRIIDGEGLQPSRWRSAGLHGEALSARELEVLRLLAKGAKNADIGKRLHIANTTVRTHVTNILSKLGAANRVQATLYALFYGLTTLEECLDPKS